jgi:hypothetical protein
MFVCMIKFVAVHSCYFVFKIVEGFFCLFVFLYLHQPLRIPSCSTPFQFSHELNFALKIVK